MKKRKTKTKRHTYIGTVEKYSRKPNRFYDETISINNIKSIDGGDVDSFDYHAWFILGKNLMNINANPGDIIQFEASIKNYKHNYKNKNHDSKKMKNSPGPPRLNCLKQRIKSNPIKGNR